jgi:hypothetical protein
MYAARLSFSRSRYNRLYRHGAKRGAIASSMRPAQFDSSAGAGGIPRPARLSIRFAIPASPRSARSRKYSSVLIADNFSATATLMNWLSATPSASETRRISSSSEVLQAQGYVTPSHSSLYRLPRVSRPHDANTEIASCLGEVPYIKVTSQSACPLTAVSSTISSAGSFNLGRQRNLRHTGIMTFASASGTAFTSPELRPHASKCSGRVRTASYSNINGTEASTSISWSSKRRERLAG